MIRFARDTNRYPTAYAACSSSVPSGAWAVNSAKQVAGLCGFSAADALIGGI